MITKEQMLLILAILKTAYSRFDDFRDPKKLATVNELWHRHFKSCDFNILEEAVHRCIDKATFPPTIAEIRIEYKKLIDKIPSADEAWESLMINIRNFGLYRIVEGTYSLDETLRKAVENIGGYRHICLVENRELEKLQERFFKAYGIAKDTTLESLMVSDVPRIEGKTDNAIQ